MDDCAPSRFDIIPYALTKGDATSVPGKTFYTYEKKEEGQQTFYPYEDIPTSMRINKVGLCVEMQMMNGDKKIYVFIDGKKYKVGNIKEN